MPGGRIRCSDCLKCRPCRLDCPAKKIHMRGHYWKDWRGHVQDEDEDSFFDILISQAEENDNRAIENEIELSHMAKWFRRCFVLLIYSITLSLSGQLTVDLQL